jgi:pilus assembly protein Flp/PilA
MRKIVDHLAAFLKDEEGPAAVEYAVLLALITVACISAITALGQNASGTFAYVATKVSSS